MIATALLALALQSAGPRVEFLVEELLTNPTTTSVELSLMPGEPAEFFVEFGLPGSGLPEVTSPMTVGAGERATFRLDGLEPGTRYVYRAHIRRPGQHPFEARAAHAFRTLRQDLEATVRFGYTADSHITGRYLKYLCSPTPARRRYLTEFETTLRNMLSSELDFVVAGGDNFMLHGQSFGCDEVPEYGQGTVQDADQADRRVEAALSPRFWGRVATSLPLFLVLGNHDGEARFGNTTGSCAHFASTWSLSRAARLKHLPDPGTVYSSGTEQAGYYTFVSGPVRVIVLDVMTGPDRYPTVDTWTLGPAQLRWFKRVVEGSHEPWKLVFIEHLVTSASAGPQCLVPGGGSYQYGRGGIRVTDDGTIRGEFLGEQAYIQELMRENGVDAFFHGHDHVAVVGEKKAVDGSGEGVVYVLGGIPAGSGLPGWGDEPWFRHQMDYDDDGVPDFLSNVNGSVQAGFYRITVHGRDRVEVEYVGTDQDDPAANGETIFSFQLFSDGTNSLHF